MHNWFVEELEMDLGRSVQVRYKNVLESVTSRFQHIDVYDTIPFGKMLVHDEVIMLTEFDEAHYHEMIVHVAMNTHPNPENVLVIGGGDGGTLREVLKHKEVKTGHLCEIDDKVVDVCKKHFPALSCSFDDPRTEVFYEDGAEFIKQRKNFYQIIIVDSSDPIGPAEVLFQEEFYKNMREALADDGIIVTQSESFMYHGDIIRNIASFSRKLFPIYHYYYTMVPTYPSGLIGFSFCSKKLDPIRDFKKEKIDTLKDLKYYSEDMHRAAFILPAFFKL